MIATGEISIHKASQSKIEQVDFDNIQFGKVYSDHMFEATYADGAWKDFQIVPYDYLKLSPASPAIHYGQSIFEGLKAYKTKSGKTQVFRPLANFERMNASAVRMCMPTVPENLFMDALDTLIKLDSAWVPGNPGTSLYIRPFMFSADEYIGIRPSDTFKFMVLTCPVGQYYSKPVKVKIETHYTRAIEGGTGYAKAAGNYAGALYPAKLAQEKGYDQLVWTDGKEHRYIEESGTMNVMFMIDGKLITAPLGDTILHGITRDSVNALAKSWGVPVEERRITVDEVIAAAKSGSLTEAFGAGTAATIAQIALIGYDGADYALPPVETRTFSNKVLTTLDQIKYGEIEDEFGWIHLPE